MNPLRPIENLFYAIRRFIWNYPEWLWIRENSVYQISVDFYLAVRPYSHFLVAFVVAVVVSVYAIGDNKFKLFASPQDVFIEGVVVGIDESGDLQSLSKINPLYPTLVQLERDLNELIYEPLIRYEQDASITLVLADQIERVQEGAEYEFTLRDDVYWQDSTEQRVRKFSADDVVRTLEIISEIDKEDISYVQAVKQMAWEKVGENKIRICTTTPALLEQLPEEMANRKCTGVQGEKPILANFLELISFKIIPAHLSDDITSRNINSPEPLLNRQPVGTGPYKFHSVTQDSIVLVSNEQYHDEKAKIGQLQFRLFRDARGAVDSLQNGEIHALSTTSVEFFTELGQYPQIVTYTSPILRNQYWAIYLNLRKDLNDVPQGPDFFQDVRVRRAISSAIDRDRVLQTLLGIGEEAWGPIYRSSEYFNPDANWYRYDPDRANQLLEAAGWELDPNLKIRRKDQRLLSFSLSFVDTPDRQLVVESIRQDLKEVGIEIIPDPKDLSTLSAEVVTPKIFDTLFYGMHTFVDPDRYELFHSEQSLNLASYRGKDLTVMIEGSETVRVPKVDKLLELSRSFDPIEGKKKRKENYFTVQELIASEAPVVFLYHPQFIYYVSDRIGNLDLSGATNLEQRFRNVTGWGLR